MADTVFAKIMRGDIPADIVYEDGEMIAIRDINPAAPTHILVIPRKPIVNMDDAGSDDADLLGRLQLRAAQIARDEGIADDGYRLVFNVNKDGGQSVDHLHLHILGGRKMSWPPG